MRICILVLFIFIHLTAYSQIYISSSTKTQAEMLEVLKVSEITPLSFGKFSLTSDHGTISITSTGIAVSNINSVGYFFSFGVFLVTSKSEATYDIVLPILPVYIYHEDSEYTMMVNDWNYFILSEDHSSQQIGVGATLYVHDLSTNPIGLYHGTYVLIFSYN